MANDPQWVARNGEFVFFQSSTTSGNRVYFYANNQWNWIAGSPTGGSVSAAGTEGSVQINSSGTFGANSGFFYSINSNLLVISSGGLYINTQTDDTIHQNRAALHVAALNSSAGQPVLRISNSGGMRNQFEVQQINRSIFGEHKRDGGSGSYDLYVVGGAADSHLVGSQANNASTALHFKEWVSNLAGNDAIDATNVREVGSIEGVNNLVGGTFNSGSWIEFVGAARINLFSGCPSFKFPTVSRSFSDTVKVTTQNFIVIDSCTVAGTTINISNGSTLYIEGNINSGSVVIQNNYSLWVDQGPCRFDGDVIVNGSFLVGTNSENAMVPSVLYTSFTNQAVANVTAETILIGSGRGNLQLPVNYFKHGKVIRLLATGLLSTQLTPPTLNVRIRLGGGTITGSAILVTGDQTPAGSLANVFWRVAADLVCYTTGATGTIVGQSVFEHMTGLTGNPTFWEMVTSPIITLDTTTQLTVQLTADWGVGVAAGDSMNCTNFSLESLN